MGCFFKFFNFKLAIKDIKICAQFSLLVLDSLYPFNLLARKGCSSEGMIHIKTEAKVYKVFSARMKVWKTGVEQEIRL